MKLKGIVMKSYLNQNPYPKPKNEWVHHSSTRQQIRNLRNRCRVVLDSRDPEVQETARRVVRSTLDDPNPIFGYLHLFVKGLEASEDSGVSWVVAMNYLMDRFEQKVIELETGEWICGCGVTVNGIRLVCVECGMHRTAEKRNQDHGRTGTRN